MPSILETILNPAEATGISDVNKTLGLSSLSAAAASANAYLAATLVATTPEVRRLFGEYLTQSLMAQEALTGLAVKREWVRPYESSENQLKLAYQEAEKLTSSQAQ
jgi:spore coat protein CotF